MESFYGRVYSGAGCPVWTEVSCFLRKDADRDRRGVGRDDFVVGHPQDPQLTGFKVFSEYLSHTGEHFSSPSTVAAQGGVLGALLYSLSSLLFARTGTVLVIFALLALAALLMIKTEVCVAVAVAHRSFTS